MCIHHASKGQIEDVRIDFVNSNRPLADWFSVTERCQQMASLLRGLRSCANADDDARIADLLEAVSDRLGFWTVGPVADETTG